MSALAALASANQRAATLGTLHELHAGMGRLDLDRLTVPSTFGVAGAGGSYVSYDRLDVVRNRDGELALWLYEGALPVVERPLTPEHPCFEAVLSEHAAAVVRVLHQCGRGPGGEPHRNGVYVAPAQNALAAAPKPIPSAGGSTLTTDGSQVNGRVKDLTTDGSQVNGRVKDLATDGSQVLASGQDLTTVAPLLDPEDPRRFTDSGIGLETVYGPSSVVRGLEERLGEPGAYPFTRGVHPGMYRDRLWTMRQYAGYATAKESNERYRYLLDHGSTGLSIAFDLPTQLGLDSDHSLCLGEVGRTGVAVDTIDDMRAIFDGIPLEKVSTSMTINAPAVCLLALYELVGEEQGVPAHKLRGTTQNDILKEYIARGTFIYPPKAGLRLTTDLFAYCHERMPKWNTISISGYHFREKGASAVQEVAFTLADGIAYVQAALDTGLAVEDFAPRLAFFFNAHNNVFQEVAKFRAARRMWARIMKERFGATDERSLKLRFHTQTGGVTLTAQQPENNIARVALQAFSAVCGGTQSLHTNGFDEALALPTERAARIALRTQQIVGYESGATDTVDPFAGSYFIEALTDEIDARASALIERVDELGGAVEAIEFMKTEIEESAFGYQERYRTGQDVVVGVNRFADEDAGGSEFSLLRVDSNVEREQVQRLEAFKANRDGSLVARRLSEVQAAANGTENMVAAVKRALGDRCTLGEVCEAMREVFGRYHQPGF